MLALITRYQLPLFVAPYQTRSNRIMLFLQTGTLVSGFYCVAYYSDAVSMVAYAVAGIVAGAVCGLWAEKYL